MFVDGERITVLGTKVLAHQKISIDKRAALEQLSRITVLLNKPLGYVSGQAEDGYQPASGLVTSTERGGAPLRDNISEVRSERRDSTTR